MKKKIMLTIQIYKDNSKCCGSNPMTKKIMLTIQVDKDNPKCCGSNPNRCDFRASDCIIFGFLKGTWEKPLRHKDCVKAEIK
jgi:hypothetical protein